MEKTNQNLCSCCGMLEAELNISFKPDDTVFKVPLCSDCFDHNKINERFLDYCLYQHSMRLSDVQIQRESRGELNGQDEDSFIIKL